MPGNETLSQQIITGIQGEQGAFELRSFPDDETYVRVLSNVENKNVIIVCTLHAPDKKLLPLFFLCRLLKDMRAASITLVAPYLSYMRQDKQFKPDEAVTSVYFASLLSGMADRLVTVDPHLHRRTSMQEIYSIPCDVLHAAGTISEWIKQNVHNALIIGPDSESRQWVSEVAKNAGAPFVILEKVRTGDNEVEVSIPQVDTFKEHTPVLVDDIISTAHTMIETVNHLKQAGMKAPVCIGVHAVFAANACAGLKNSGAGRIVTCNTIAHETNGIDISPLLVKALL